MPVAGSFLDRHLALDGYMRLRFDVMENLDLNHGPTPTTGQPLFPVNEGSDAPITSSNIRLRFDPTIMVGWGVSFHARIDILDNVVLGSTPEGLPTSVWAPMSGGSASQLPPASGHNSDSDSIRVKRAWAQVILPIGLLSAGRMGALIDWGTGFFINSGNCIDCDMGDVGDRVAFVMPIKDQLLGFAFDFGASGPTSASLRADPQAFDVDRRDDVRSYALLLTNYELPSVIERYRRAGRFRFLYGVVASLRTQEHDVPAYYLTGDRERQYTEEDLVQRGILAFAGDLWLGMRYRGWTIDLEAATVVSRIDNASLLPGTEFLQEITARQFGGVARVKHSWSRVHLQLELGVASGDDAPGFGVRSPLNQFSSQPGDIDGPQISIPGDTTVNNFRFNPDYHIDQILWRRIIGTVTDAFYARPSAAWEPFRGFTLESALISSTALEGTSTPSGEQALGLELDLAASYQIEKAFYVSMSYGVLFPFGGLRNTRLGLKPEPAQLFHVILAYLL
jgi:uncharacterized protein (TIGR04551 family)